MLSLPLLLLLLRQVKALVGATGVMLLLDTQTNTCYTARLGRAMPFTAASKGEPHVLMSPSVPMLLRVLKATRLLAGTAAWVVQLHKQQCTSRG